MHQDVFKFYLSENKVWLTDYVPIKYLNIEKYVNDIKSIY